MSNLVARLAIVAGVLASARADAPATAEADDIILSGMTWMTGYPATRNAGASPFERVLSSEVLPDVPASATRSEILSHRNGTRVHQRAVTDAATGRAYRHERIDRDDATFTIAYTDGAGDYSHVYRADSSGAYDYRSSDGFSAASAGRSAEGLVQHQR